MTNKHTPGPWIVRVNASGNPFVYRVDGVIICGVAMVREGMDRAENEANAALIASAPDLLAERDRLKAVNAKLLAALDRLIFAAECRDNTMGDQSRLIDVKASLVAATVLARSVSFEAKHARAALAKAQAE